MLSTSLTMKAEELGNRIMLLRKEKGLTQDEIAKLIGISRPVYTQMEKGNRIPSFLEMGEICQVLGVSMDKINAKDFSTDKIDDTSEIANEVEERISIPELNVEKFKNILLYILTKCAGKPNVGETVLYKLLYFADFNHYEVHEELMTGAQYKKLPFGPVPQKLTSIINQMIKNKQIDRIDSEYMGFPQKRYLPKVSPNLKLINGAEKESIDKVIATYSGWNAKAISDYSHEDIPWKASEEGEVIDYELAFYRSAPYSARVYDNE